MSSGSNDQRLEAHPAGSNLRGHLALRRINHLTSGEQHFGVGARILILGTLLVGDSPAASRASRFQDRPAPRSPIIGSDACGSSDSNKPVQRKGDDQEKPERTRPTNAE